MKTFWIMVILALILFLIPDLVQARPIEISPEDWREVKLEDEEDMVVEAPCLVEVIHGDPGIYFAPAWCLERALRTIPIAPGSALFCKLGYLAASDEMAIVSVHPDFEAVQDWAYCSDV